MMCIVMFKEESIELYCKLFCFLVFFVVIVFLNNIYSLLILFGYFFLSSRKQESNIVVLFYSFTLLGLAFGFVNGDLRILKLFLIIDFIYYFIRYIKSNKRSLLIKRSNVNHDDDIIYYNSDGFKDKNEIFIKDDRINDINNQLKKGNLLKEEEINLIKSHLDEVEQDAINERENVEHLRFANFRNVFKDRFKQGSFDEFNNFFRSYKWRFKLDIPNSLYVMCHLLILILAIVVE